MVAAYKAFPTRREPSFVDGNSGTGLAAALITLSGAQRLPASETSDCLGLAMLADGKHELDKAGLAEVFRQK
jgi:hypothetical protein